MVLPVLAAVGAARKAYQGLKGVLYIVMLILAIVVLAGTAQSNSTNAGKFNLLLGLLLFGTTILYPYINFLQPVFNVFGISEEKRYFALFVFYGITSFLIMQIAKRNEPKISGKEKTQNANAKRAATGLLVLTIFILYANSKGFDLAFNLSELIGF
jgi:hypothetical protein